MFSASVSLAILYLRICLLLPYSSVQLHGVYVEYILNMKRQTKKRNKRKGERDLAAMQTATETPDRRVATPLPACSQLGKISRVQIIVWIAKGTRQRLSALPYYYSEYNKSAVDTAADSGRLIFAYDPDGAQFSLPFSYATRERQLSKFLAFIMDFCESFVAYKYPINKLFDRRLVTHLMHFNRN